MQPQFIIDAIKYVIREANPEDVNAELTDLDSQIRNQRDLKQHLESGKHWLQLSHETQSDWVIFPTGHI